MRWIGNGLLRKRAGSGLSGYMTLEAALLMPMLLSGIVFTLYIGFYLYNVCLVRQNAYLAALRGSRMEEGSAEEIRQYTLDTLEELTEGRWLAMESIDWEAKVSLSKVTVSISATVNMPFAGWLSERLELWKIEEKASAGRIYPVTVIRGIRMVMG